MLGSVLSIVGGTFGAVDALLGGIRRGVRGAWRSAVDGPLQSLLIAILLAWTGLLILVEDVGRVVDRGVGWVERGFVFAAMAAMTFLAFNEYLAREFRPRLGDMGGVWALEGQMNMALLLMVVVGFLGASLATQERKHIAVDAIDRVLSGPSARFVRRLTNLVAAVLCGVFAHGSWEAVFRHCHDAFEGARVWSPLVAPINALVGLMPGDKYGPGTSLGSMDDWIDAQYDLGLDPFESFAFGFVQAGDRFPLWIPILFLVLAFAIMGVRFFAQALWVPTPDTASPSSTPSRRPADVILAGALPGALITMGLGAWLGTGWLVVIGAVGLVFLGAPLFVAVGVGTLACWVLLRNGSPETVVADMFEATKKQELLAIPFFVLAGNLMTRGSIATRLIAFARALIGGVPGGLGVGAVAACAFFAAISGSSPVTVIAIGSIMFPMLVKEGYSESYSMGLLSTAGGLGIIIPPSIPMIVYAIMVSNAPGVGVIDPATLFKAGIGPGVFIAGVLATYTLFLMWPRDGFEANFDGPAWFRELLRTGLRGLPSLMLPVVILGGIYGVLDLAPLGIDFAVRFTVTEAAAVAVVYALAVELLLHRELRIRDLPSVFSESAVMMGSLFLILVIAISLNRFFVFQQVPEAATAWMLERVDSPFTFLLMVNLFLLALGCVMDILSAILIVAPLLAPIAASYGIHPIHFGIMFIVNLELGYLTPPMGINLFVASTVFERSIIDVIRAVLPFLVLMLFCLAVIVWVPSLSLFLVE